MVVHLDHTKAKLPPPSPGLFEIMACDALTAFLDFLEWPKSHGEDDWRKLPEIERAPWIAVAEANYRSIALAGGAKIKKT